MLQLSVPDEVRDLLAAGKTVGASVLQYAERLTICNQDLHKTFPGNPMAYFHRLWELSGLVYVRDRVMQSRSAQLKGLLPRIWAARYAPRKKCQIGKLTTVYDFVRMIEAYLENEKQFDAVPRLPRWYDDAEGKFTCTPSDVSVSIGLIMRMWYLLFQQPDFRLELLDAEKLPEAKPVEMQEPYVTWLNRKISTLVHDNIPLLNPYMPTRSAVFRPTPARPLDGTGPVQLELPLATETSPAGKPAVEPEQVPPPTMNDALGLHADPLETDPSAKVSFTIDYLPFTREQLERFCDEMSSELSGMRCSLEVVAAHSLEVSMHIHTAWPVSEHTDETGIAKLLTVVDVVHAILKTKRDMLDAIGRLNGVRQ